MVRGSYMILLFELNMPNVGSWNGKWGGKEKRYLLTRKINVTKENKPLINNILENGYFYHDFKDGWGAGITVKKVLAVEANKLMKKSAGFCMYDWMADDIIKYGYIRKQEQLKAHKFLKEKYEKK